MSFIKKENTKKEYLNIKIRKSYTIAESTNAVLFEFETNDFESYLVWFNKGAIYTSDYTDILDISLINDDNFKYSIYKKDNDDWKKPDAKVSGAELKEELLKDYDIAIINKK